jgi:hypothetical protein
MLLPLLQSDRWNARCIFPMALKLPSCQSRFNMIPCTHQPLSYPKRDQVLWANQGRLNKIKEKMCTFQAQDYPGMDSWGKPLTPQAANKLLERLVAVSKLELKVGLLPTHPPVDNTLVRWELKSC